MEIENNFNHENYLEKNKLIEQGHALHDWFIFREDRHFGPLTTKQIRTCLKNRLISKEHHIWRPGFKNWDKIADVEAFCSYGVEKIDSSINDDEFSSVANLDSVDRIALENNALSFKEKEDASSEVEKSGEIRINFAEIFTNKGREIAIGASFVLFAAFFYYIFAGGSANPAYKNLAQIKQSKLVAVSSMPESMDQISFEIFKSHLDTNEPVLVSGTNLPKGVELQYAITGQPETLVGAYRFKQVFDVVTEDKIFASQPIRMKSGEFLPPGTYAVSVSCIGCDVERVIYNGQVNFGTQNKEKYSKDLNAFHQRTRASAKLELDELYDLALTLKGQYQKTFKAFVDARASTSAKSKWSKKSKTWLESQKKLVDLFEQLKSDKFKSKLYYLSLYENFGDLAGQIFELHVLQDSIIGTKGAKASKLKNAAQISQNINLSLEFLKSQVDLMNVNYSQSSGLPPKTGLVSSNKKGV